MARPRLFERIKASFEAALKDGCHETTISMPDPVKQYTPEEVRALRTRLHMSQGEFAVLVNVTVATVASWEQGRRPPSAAAARLLQIVDNPDAFSRIVKARKTAAATVG
jgi:putative transcriptional regulator